MLKGTKITYTDYNKIVGTLLQGLGTRAIRLTQEDILRAPEVIRRIDENGVLYFALDHSSLQAIYQEENNQ